MTYNGNQYPNGSEESTLAPFIEPRAAITTETEHIAYDDPRDMRQSLDLLAQDFRNLRQFIEAMSHDLRDIKTRITNTEQSSGGVLASIQSAIAICNRRVDRLEQRFAQVEHRRTNQY